MSGRQVARHGPEKGGRSQQGFLGQVKDIFLLSCEHWEAVELGNSIITCASYSALWVILSERKAQQGPKLQSERSPRSSGDLGEYSRGGAMEL